jgi:hypothetical protein
MKRLVKGIQSTCTTKPTTATQVYPLLPMLQGVEDHTMPSLNHPQHNGKVEDHTIGLPPHLIQELDDYSIANVFCFRAFADKVSGVVYDGYHTRKITLPVIPLTVPVMLPIPVM